MMEKKSRAKWGNKIGYALVPLFIGVQENPLDYVTKAKATIDRKKLSMESRFSFTSARILLKLFGVQAAAALITRVICNTTVSISNVVGPQEEISFFGHTMAFSAPIVCGVPHRELYPFLTRDEYEDMMGAGTGITLPAPAPPPVHFFLKTNRKTIYYSKAEIESGGIESQYRELACEKAASVCAA
nr:O-acyltransferase WSD1-like [Ipomoea batatas]